ncbi:MAG: hypothetical protein IJW04_07000 [Ruminococcus sp.]|nr:hypothetical protein [Ruminococcus sp.]
MKKIIALFLVAILAFSLVACSMMKDKTDTTTNPPANSNNANNNSANAGESGNAGNSGNSGNAGNSDNTKNTENMLESMIPDISTNVSTEGQR